MSNEEAHRPPTVTVRDYTAAFTAPIWVHKLLKKNMPWGRVDVAVIIVAIPVFLVSALTMPIWWPLLAADGDTIDRIFSTAAGLLGPTIIAATVAHYSGIRIRKFPRAGMILAGIAATQFRGPITENRRITREPRMKIATYAHTTDMPLINDTEDGTP